jgi:hypothetical protein
MLSWSLTLHQSEILKCLSRIEKTIPLMTLRYSYSNWPPIVCSSSYSQAFSHSSSMASSIGSVTTHLPPFLFAGSSHSGRMPFLKMRKSVLEMTSRTLNVLLYIRQNCSIYKKQKAWSETFRHYRLTYCVERVGFVQLVLVVAGFPDLALLSVRKHVDVPESPFALQFVLLYTIGGYFLTFAFLCFLLLFPFF